MKSNTRRLVLAGLMAALLAVMSQISIPIGLVPFNMAVFGVFFTGLLLPPAYAAGSVFAYLMMGFIGLPVFVGFKGGPQVFAGPTGGFLAGYLIIVLATSVGALYSKNYFVRFGAGLVGLAGCYIAGTFCFMLVTGNTFMASLAVCVFPFVITDIGKLVVAIAMVRMVEKRKSGSVIENEPAGD